MKTLILSSIVNGTSTNFEALALYLELRKSAENKEAVTLSFAKISHVSSSFLNSSIGQIMEEYGFEYFAKNVKFVNCTTSVAIRIKDYVSKYKSFAKA